MINKNIEPYYDAMLNLFLGAIVILIFYALFDSPRIVVIENTSKNKNNSSKNALKPNDSDQNLNPTVKIN